MRGSLAKIERRAFLRAAVSFAAASVVFPACGAPVTDALRIQGVAVFPLNTPGRNRLPFDDFRAGLQDYGFVEGETVQIRIAFVSSRARSDSAAERAVAGNEWVD